MSVPNGLYQLADASGDRLLSLSGVRPGTGAGTQLVMLTESEGTPEGFRWKLQYEPSQKAYSIQHPSNGTYVSFEGGATENAHLGAHSGPRFFEFHPQGQNTYKIGLKSTRYSIGLSPCIMYPPMLAIQSDTYNSLVWKLTKL